MVYEDRLETVLTAIEQSEAAGGRKLWMGTFRSEEGQVTGDGHCGTSACLAGWTALVAPGVVWRGPVSSIVVRDPKHWMDESVPEFARRWLGLTDPEAETIFYAFGVNTLAELKAQIGSVLGNPDIYHGEDDD